MKLPKLPFAGTLLFCYAVYTAFVPVSIAHSIILFSLSLLTGFELYIQSHQLPSVLTRIENSRNELQKVMDKDRESFDKKLKELQEDMSRQAIARANQNTGAPKKAPIQF